MMKTRLIHMSLGKEIDKAIHDSNREKYLDLMETVIELKNKWRTIHLYKHSAKDRKRAGRKRQRTECKTALGGE